MVGGKVVYEKKQGENLEPQRTRRTPKENARCKEKTFKS